MATFAVLGATGATGRLIAAAAAGRGHALVLVGRDRHRLDGLAAALRAHGDGGGEVALTVRVADLAGADAVDGLLATTLASATDGADVVLSGCPEAVATPLRRAAVAAGLDLVDTAASPAAVRAAVTGLDDPARATRCTVVPGVGWRTSPGDLLADVAASRVERPREVHVAYLAPDRGGVLAASSLGERRDLVDDLSRAVPVVAHGRPVDEHVGDARRLAWFPRPLGPHHAAGVAGLEPLGVPRHVPGLRTVRTYLAVSSARAELLQAAGHLARRPRTRGPLVRRLVRAGRGDPNEARRAAARWACVVEAEGESGLARAWMNGRDPGATSALLVTLVAEAVAAGRAAHGVVPTSLAVVPRDLLDAVADASSARWSVRRIEGG